jgi:hypothetical protein
MYLLFSLELILVPKRVKQQGYFPRRRNCYLAPNASICMLHTRLITRCTLGVRRATTPISSMATDHIEFRLVVQGQRWVQLVILEEGHSTCLRNLHISATAISGYFLPPLEHLARLLHTVGVALIVLSTTN